jgi:hypothetical protein
LLCGGGKVPEGHESADACGRERRVLEIRRT